MYNHKKCLRPKLDQDRRDDPSYVKEYNEQLTHYRQLDRQNTNRRKKRAEEAIAAMDMNGTGAEQDPVKKLSRKYLKQIGKEAEEYRAVKYLTNIGFMVPPNADPDEVRKKAYTLAMQAVKEFKPTTMKEKVAKIEENDAKMKRLRDIKEAKKRMKEQQTTST